MKRFVNWLIAVSAAAATVLCSVPALAQAEEAPDGTGFTIGQTGIVIVIVLMTGVMLFGDLFYKNKDPSAEETPADKREHDE